MAFEQVMDTLALLSGANAGPGGDAESVARCAVLDASGNVVNTIVADPQTFNPGDGLTLRVSDDASIGDRFEGDDLIKPEPPPIAPVRRLVLKSVIVERLNAAGKLAAARAALDADLYARERWYAPDKPSIYADDPEALALLEAIGADPKVILA